MELSLRIRTATDVVSGSQERKMFQNIVITGLKAPRRPRKSRA